MFFLIESWRRLLMFQSNLPDDFWCSNRILQTTFDVPIKSSRRLAPHDQICFSFVSVRVSDCLLIGRIFKLFKINSQYISPLEDFVPYQKRQIKPSLRLFIIECLRWPNPTPQVQAFILLFQSGVSDFNPKIGRFASNRTIPGLKKIKIYGNLVLKHPGILPFSSNLT